MGILVLVLLFIYFIILCCCWKDKLNAAIIIAKITATFLTENFHIYCIPVMTSVITLLFTVYLIAVIAGFTQIYDRIELQDSGFSFIMFLFGVFYLFFTYYFYYLMVFLLAFAVSVWYYKIQDAGCCSGFSASLKALGSKTYAAVVITLIKILQFLAKSGERSDNLCVVMCSCCINCCLSCV
jgi:hypothetical protein